MIKKALGGERVGSGKKMDVELHAFSSSTHNVTRVTRTSQAVGTIVPIYTRLLLKDNKIDIDLNALCFTNPTEGPCYGEYELQIHAYTAASRLYQGKLHMNMLEQGTKMNEIKFPQILFTGKRIDWTRNPDNQQINSSCIHKYLGTSGIGDTAENQTFVQRYREATRYLAYWDIYGNYYGNQQEKVGYVIHAKNLGSNIDVDIVPVTINGTNRGNLKQDETRVITFVSGDTIEVRIIYWSDSDIELAPENFALIDEANTQFALDEIFETFETTIRYAPPGATRVQKQLKATSYVGGTNAFNSWANNQTDPDAETEPDLLEFDLANLNEMRMDILAAVKETTPFIIDENSIAPYGTSLGLVNGQRAMTLTQEGLGVRTYKSDIFNNWLDTAAIDEINSRSSIQIDGDGKFTIESFMLMEKLYKYLNRIQLAGNTVDDWEEAAYGTKSHRPTEKPVFEGALHKTIEFNEVISTASDPNKPLGTMAATGKLGRKHDGGKISIKVDETSYLIIVASIVPLIDYSQGNDWEGDLESYEDLHNPNFDKIGFQNLPTDRMASWDTKVNSSGIPIMKSAGKQPSWTHYQTNFNANFGTFAEPSEMWMVNNRNYEADAENKTIKDLTSYIDPKKWNNIFAYKSRSAQNYKMQYLIEATQRLLMSANQIPGL